MKTLVRPRPGGLAHPATRPDGPPPRLRARRRTTDEASTFRPNPGRPAARPAPGSGKKARGPVAGTESEAEPLAPAANWWERIFFGTVSSGQLAQFCRQFASYLHAGVDYNRTLSSLQKQFARSPLGPAVGRMHQAIKAGSTLEEAMAREPRIFSTMFLSMIRVAEARGGVPETLRMMGNHYEARQRLIRQARSAMIYPIIVLVAAGGVVALITIVLLPMFAEMLRDINRKADAPLAQPRPAGLQRVRPRVGPAADSRGPHRHAVPDLSGSTRRPRARPRWTACS